MGTKSRLASWPQHTEEQRRNTFLDPKIIGLTALLFCSHMAVADILIMRSGSRYEGTVTDQSESYLLVRPGGGRVTFPKAMVKEVIKKDTLSAPRETPTSRTATKPGPVRARRPVAGWPAEGAATTPQGAEDCALVAAVEQAVGVLVEAETVIKNEDVIREKIITATNAFVETYRVARRWQEAGLHHCRIVARVRSRKLRDRLQANRIATRKFTGEDLYGRIVTDDHAKRGAREILKACLTDLPQQVLTGRVAGQPVAVSSPDMEIPDGITRLRIPIRIAVDPKAYAQAMARILPKLDHIAKVKYTARASLQQKPGKPYAVFECRALRRVDNNPISPKPGDLVADVLLEPGRKAREPVFAPWKRVVQHAKEKGQRIAVVWVVKGLRVGGAQITAYGLDEEAVQSLPRANSAVAAVRMRLLDSENREIASREIQYRFSAWWSSFILNRRYLSKWWVVTVLPGAYKSGSFQSSTFASSFRGYFYIDLSTTQIKRICGLVLSVRWMPTRAK